MIRCRVEVAALRGGGWDALRPTDHTASAVDARVSDGCGDLLCALSDPEGNRMPSISIIALLARMPSVLQAASIALFLRAHSCVKKGLGIDSPVANSPGPTRRRVQLGIES